MILALLLAGAAATSTRGAPLDPLAVRNPGADLSRTASGESGGAVSSPDGRFLLFLSTANDLVTNRSNGPVMDLFVREMATGAVSLISVTPDGLNGGDGDTYQGAISADGRFVAFESSARNLVGGHAGHSVEIFLRDRLSNVTQRIPPPRVPLTFGSVTTPLHSPLAMDGAGRRLAWVRSGHVHVYDRETGVTAYVTRPISGPPPGSGAQSWDPQFSEDGQRLVFGSSVENLVRPGQGPIRPLPVYVFRFDRGNLDPTNLMQIRLTNAQLPNVAGGYSDSGHSLDATGRFLTFAVSPPSPMQATAALGVFRMDLVSGTVQHVSAGLLLNRGAALRMAAADRGSAVAFQVVQGNPPATTLTNGLFVWTEGSGLKAVLPESATGNQPLIGTPLEFSPDGRRLLFTSTGTNVVAGLEDVRVRYLIHDLESGRNLPAVDDQAQPRSAVLSRDGGGVLFESSVPSLVDSDLNEASDLFLQPANGGTIALMTSGIETLIPQTATGLSSLGDHAFSVDGRFRTFTSTAEDIVSGDDNGAPDVFLQDRQDGVTRLLSIRQDGLGSGNGPSGQAVLSDDGRYAAFISGATNLVAEDTNDRPDLFRRDLVAGVTTLVSAGLPSPGPIAAAVTFAMSRDGQRFVWLQRESGSTRILFRDMAEATARSLATGSACGLPSISRDGSTTAFTRQGHVFVYAIATGDLSVLFSDEAIARQILLNSGGTRLVLFGANGAPAVFERSSSGAWERVIFPGERIGFRTAKDGVLSSDDRWLAFAGAVGEKPPPSVDGNLGFQIYLMDLTTGQTMKVSRVAFGGILGGDSDRPAFSPDGRQLIFRSAAGNLVADDDNDAADLFVHDRATEITRLVSRSPITGIPWGTRSIRGRFGAVGGEVWMQTFAASPVAGDFNGSPEFVRWELPPDRDGDGLDDRVEQDRFGGLEQAGSGDLDQDGMSNADELAAGTDPARSDSVLMVRILAETGDGWLIGWPSVPGRRYRLLTKGSLTPNGDVPWESAGEVITATGTSLETRILRSEWETGRYFRLSVGD